MNPMTENEVVSQEHIFPKSFLQLLSDVEVENANEALIILLHSYLLEVGFVPKGIASDPFKCMPENWKSNGIFKIEYCHGNIPDAFCWVTWVPLYGNLAIHGTVEKENLEDSVYMKLPANVYVSAQGDISNPQHLFSQTKELSRLFKDGFCYPLLALLEDSANYKPSFGLSGLFDEVKIFILKLLPVETIVSLSSVNKDFHNQANSSYLWKYLFIRDFGLTDPNVLESVSEDDWKEMYKAEYQRRKNRQTFRPLPMYHGNPWQLPHVFPVGPNFDVDLRLDMDPALQQAFPLMRSRFRPSNWFYPGGYQYLRRFW